MNPYGFLSLPLGWLAALLLLVHLLYDFHWQGGYISAEKKNSNLLLSVHAATWALMISVVLYLVGTLSVSQLMFLFVTHWVMDWFKCHRMTPGYRALAIDQTVHLLTLIAVLGAWGR